MYNNLKKFHQSRTNQLNNMFGQMQTRNQQMSRQGMQPNMQGRGFGPNPQFGGQGYNPGMNPSMASNMNRGGGFFGGSQSQNKNQQVIQYLGRIRQRVVQDLNQAGRSYRDHTNFNNSSDLCLLMEVTMRINDKNVGVMVKMQPSFPKSVPRLKLTETYIHDDIDRANNAIRVENICTWNTNKKIPDLVLEVENYFKISPPENSPELQGLLSDIVRVNKSIQALRNFNFASFQHQLLRDQKMALNNGDYHSLRNAQEFKSAQALMLQLSNKLRGLKQEVLALQSEIKELSEDKREVIERFQERLGESESIRSQFEDLSLKYDAENIKKFLQNESNKMMYKKEGLKQKMLECDLDELGDLQEEYLRVNKHMNLYSTLLEKAFAY